MKILIYGAGVIGSIFAGKLALAGNDVTVLARGKRFEELVNEGIILVNPKTKKVEQIPVKVTDTLLVNILAKDTCCIGNQHCQRFIWI